MLELYTFRPIFVSPGKLQTLFIEEQKFPRSTGTHVIVEHPEVEKSQSEAVVDRLRVLFEIATALQSPEYRDLRRAPRVPSDVVLGIYGHAPDGDSFYSAGRAINVSETGALILVEKAPSCGDQVLLVNQANSQEQLATVVRFAGKRNGLEGVGVAFTEANGAFWRGATIKQSLTADNSAALAAAAVGVPKTTWKRSGHL